MGTSFTKRHYDRMFKERAVKLSYERNNIKELAQELGVSSERIYKWRAEFARHGEASFQGHGVERLSDEGKRVKELRNTKLELEILKKAIAIFSQTDK